MKGLKMNGLYYMEAIHSMLDDENISLKKLSALTDIDFNRLNEIREGAIPDINTILVLIEYTKKFFKNGRKYSPPYDINGKAKVEEMSIYIVCEYFDGYDVMVDFGNYTVTKYFDRQVYSELESVVDGYFECIDEPEEMIGYANQVRRFFIKN